MVNIGGGNVRNKTRQIYYNDGNTEDIFIGQLKDLPRVGVYWQRVKEDSLPKKKQKLITQNEET